MDGTTIAIIIGLFAMSLFVIRQWIVGLEKKTGTSQELIEWLKSSSATTDQKLSRNMEMFNNRLDRAATVIGSLREQIGEMAEVGRSMRDLQEFLTSPKLRGNIGEQILKEILAQNLPKDMFKLQHGFKSGEKVDAVIITSQGLLAIDSKFPMENFKRMHDSKSAEADKKLYEKEFVRDVKKHVADIAKKYILVGEGTLDYAMMYIPSESVYYEIINSGDLYDYAAARRIFPVSPTTFNAYIKAILMSYEGQKIQTKAKEILVMLRAIKKEYEKTDESLNLLGRHLTNAYTQLTSVSRNFLSMGQKLTSTNVLSGEERTVQEKLPE